MESEVRTAHKVDQSLYQRIERIEHEQDRQQKAVRKLHTDFRLIRARLLTQIHPDPGWVIRLQFSPTSPIHEWEDQKNGWRVQGQGSRYSSQEHAQAHLDKLRLIWPDYPLELLFCE